MATDFSYTAQLLGQAQTATSYTTPAIASTAGGLNTVGIGSGVSTGLQVVGAIYSAIQAKQIGAYNQQVAQANAQQDAFSAINSAQQHERLAAMLQDEIKYSESVAAFNERELARTLTQQEGVSAARIGASGLALVGSPVAQLEEQMRQGSVQQALLNMQARLQQRALREQQTQEQYAATVARFSAGQRLRLGQQQSDIAGFDAQSRSTVGILGAVGSTATGAQNYQYLQAYQNAIKARA